jgi:hypothetical protein
MVLYIFLLPKTKNLLNSEKDKPFKIGQPLIKAQGKKGAKNRLEAI